MLTHRIIFDDNSTLIDYSLQAKGSGFTFTMISAEDYLYIGQNFPFNSFFIKVTTANTNSASLSIEYWNGSTWTAALDILDGTSTAGKMFAKSGVVRFTIDRQIGWHDIQDTSDESNLGNLNNVTIYDMYWVRVKASADLSATTLAQVSYLFCDNDLLLNLDPDINDYLTNWQGGKTDWVDQSLIASRHVVVDLKKKGFIRDQAQILLIDRELELLCAYKTLVLIYNGLGGDKFNNKKADTQNTYNEILQGISIAIDQNNDGLLRKSEIRTLQGNPIR